MLEGCFNLMSKSHCFSGPVFLVLNFTHNCEHFFLLEVTQEGYRIWNKRLSLRWNKYLVVFPLLQSRLTAHFTMVTLLSLESRKDLSLFFSMLDNIFLLYFIVFLGVL